MSCSPVSLSKRCTPSGSTPRCALALSGSPHVDAAHVCGAFVGHEHAGDHRDGGGLTGAVVDQSVEGSGGDVEVDAVDGDLLTECLGERGFRWRGGRQRSVRSAG